MRSNLLKCVLFKICNFQKTRKKLRREKLCTSQKIIIYQSIGWEILNKIAKQLLKMLNKRILCLIKKRNALQIIFFSICKLTIKNVHFRVALIIWVFQLNTMVLLTKRKKKRNLNKIHLYTIIFYIRH